MPLRRRLELLAAAGAAGAFVVGRDARFFAQSAEAFIGELLVERLRVAAVVEGADFRFGCHRLGDVAMLTAAGRRYGFEVVVVPQRRLAVADLAAADAPETAALGEACGPLPGECRPAETVVVASRLIRSLVGAGRVGAAGLCLGRPFEVQGRVVPGQGRGRQLGYATANLDLEGRVCPGPGVYAARATLLPDEATLIADGLGKGSGMTRLGDTPEPAFAGQAGGGLPAIRDLPAAVFAGSPPTFPGEPPRLEALILSGDVGDIYGRTLRLELLARVRGLVKFAGPQTLAAQIARDIAAVQALVAGAQTTAGRHPSIPQPSLMSTAASL